MVYVMEGNKPLMVMPVSVGRTEDPTPTGNFRIYRKVKKYRANTHGYAYKGSRSAPTEVKWTKTKDMPTGGYKFIGTPLGYWCEFKEGYGFHIGWVKPYPCSSGCIRMHENLAPKFFRLVKTGTPLNISYRQPEDATYGLNVKHPLNADSLPNYPAALRMSDRIFDYHKPPVYQ